MRIVLLCTSLGKGHGGVKQEDQSDQNELDLHVHPTASTHLEPGI